MQELKPCHRVRTTGRRPRITDGHEVRDRQQQTPGPDSQGCDWRFHSKVSEARYLMPGTVRCYDYQTDVKKIASDCKCPCCSTERGPALCVTCIPRPHDMSVRND